MACMVGSFPSRPDFGRSARARRQADILEEVPHGVCSSVHGPDPYCWHVPFALWVYVTGLTSLGHGLHGRLNDWILADLPQSQADILEEVPHGV